MKDAEVEPVAMQMDWIRPKSKPSADDFVREHREAVFRLALAITGRADLAEDVTQETMLRAIKQRHKLEEPAKWLRVVATRRAMTLLASKTPEPELESAARHAADEEIAVRQTLAKLSADQQTLLALAIGEGWSYEEIAEALAVPVGTVGSRLHAAKSAFRKQWGEER
jgi:RNA polymerase sigma-70 factor (ECF subfamily)